MADTVIVVGTTELDEYGNMWVTPKGGGERVKIAAKRSGLHPLFEQGKAVLLKWQTYQDHPYVADAKLVAGELQPAVTPPQVETPDQPEIDKSQKKELTRSEEINWHVAIKEIGECIRRGLIKNEGATKPYWTLYWLWLSNTLGVKPEKEK